MKTVNATIVPGVLRYDGVVSARGEHDPCGFDEKSFFDIPVNASVLAYGTYAGTRSHPFRLVAYRGRRGYVLVANLRVK